MEELLKRFGEGIGRELAIQFGRMCENYDARIAKLQMEVSSTTSSVKCANDQSMVAPDPAMAASSNRGYSTAQIEAQTRQSQIPVSTQCFVATAQ